MGERLCVDDFSFLCNQPLNHLLLQLDHLDTTDNRGVSWTVTATWKEAWWPGMAEWSDHVTYTAICVEALTGYVESIAASPPSSSPTALR